VTETELARALAATRLELLNVERDRDEWRRKFEARKQSYEAAVREKRQADTDADCAWQQVDLLRSRIEDLELELSGVEVAFP
jgi:peptide subunit release factor 1 (eRF1)